MQQCRYRLLPRFGGLSSVTRVLPPIRGGSNTSLLSHVAATSQSLPHLSISHQCRSRWLSITHTRTLTRTASSPHHRHQQHCCRLRHHFQPQSCYLANCRMTFSTSTSSASSSSSSLPASNYGGNGEQYEQKHNKSDEHEVSWKQLIGYFGLPFGLATILFATAQRPPPDIIVSSLPPPSLLETPSPFSPSSGTQSASSITMNDVTIPPWYQRLGRRLRLLWRMFILFWVWLPVVITRPFLSDPQWGEYIITAMERSGPAFIKLGQWAATRPDLFPPLVCDTLSKLQTGAKAHSIEYSYKALKEAFGEEQANRITLTKLLGSGSLAQVHKATITDNDGRTREVAVKVILF
jgi:hypothetical protein